MAKKFFYDKVHNTKKTIIHLIIIGVCVIGIIICFVITSNFQGENKKGEVSLKSEVTIEVNEEYTNEIFFSKIENVDINTINVKYPNTFDPSTPGEYTVTINIDGNDYDTKLIVVDTIKPNLLLKELTIKENEPYNAQDFVTSCSDNSGKDCIIEFYSDGTDEDGNPLDYSIYKEEGIYPIKISASDYSDNQNILETILIVEKESEVIPPDPGTEPEIPTVCKYGNNDYDKENYLLALDITSGGCAISLDLYNQNEEIKKIMETETTRIVKDVQKLNITGTLYLDRRISAITNLTATGLVGYELRMVYTFDDGNGGEQQTIADYKLNSAGKRVFITNNYNLGE